MSAQLDATPVSTWPGPVIDSDVHVSVPSIEALFPHMADHWVEFARETGFTAPPGLATVYPPGAPTTARPEWIPRDGRPPASELALLQRDVLDAGRVERAVVSCYWGLESVRHPDFGAGLVSAVNDWLIAEWLERDERLRASIVVSGQDPVAAAREIDRVGQHPGVVQVLLPLRSSRLYGSRLWHPMFAAIERNDLVAGVHYGGVPDGPPTPTGWPSWFLEEHVGMVQVCLAQITSMVAEGLFEQFPGVRVAFLECGFTWLAPTLWRLDKEWKGLRRDIPWVRRPPSSSIRERVRLSVAPLDAGPPEQFAQVLDWLGSEELLMFASDYPHAHDEDISLLLDAVSETARPRIMAANAREHYRL
jgi:uncharacterized protein